MTCTGLTNTLCRRSPRPLCHRSAGLSRSSARSAQQPPARAWPCSGHGRILSRSARRPAQPPARRARCSTRVAATPSPLRLSCRSSTRAALAIAISSAPRRPFLPPAAAPSRHLLVRPRRCRSFRLRAKTRPRPALACRKA